MYSSTIRDRRRSGEREKKSQKKLISLLLRILRRLSVSKTVTDKLYSSETRKTRKTTGKERIRAFLELRIFCWKWNDIVNSSPFRTFIKYVSSYFFVNSDFFLLVVSCPLFLRTINDIHCESRNAAAGLIFFFPLWVSTSCADGKHFSVVASPSRFLAFISNRFDEPRSASRREFN